MLSERTYRIRLIEDMLGTVAKNEEVYKKWIESKKPANGASDNEIETIQISDEKGWTGFHKDNEHGLFIFDYMVKGQLKAAGNVLKDVIGIKALRSKIDDFVFIFPRRIYLGKQEPDGYLERPIRVLTMQGPRVTVVRSDKVSAGTEIEFKITLFKHKELSWKVIDTLLNHGRFMGLGQFRNGSYGRFEVISYNES